MTTTDPWPRCPCGCNKIDSRRLAESLAMSDMGSTHALIALDDTLRRVADELHRIAAALEARAGGAP